MTTLSFKPEIGHQRLRLIQLWFFVTKYISMQLKHNYFHGLFHTVSHLRLAKTSTYMNRF